MPLKIISKYYYDDDGGNCYAIKEEVVDWDDLEKVLDEYNLSHKRYDILDGEKILIGGKTYFEGGYVNVHVEVE